MILRPRIGVVRNPRARRRWTAIQEFCQVCGLSREFGWPIHAAHHLVGGAARSDEKTNLLFTCDRDHRLGHNERIKRYGIVLPRLTLGMLLRVKQLRQPEEFNAERLTVLLGRPLPDMEELPELFRIEWDRNALEREELGL